MSSVTTTAESTVLSSTTVVSLTTTTPSATSSLAPTTTSVAPPVTTTTLAPSTSIVSAEPSTTYVAPPTTAEVQPTTVVTQVTSIITLSPSGNTQGPIITTITSTQPVVTFTPTASQASTRSQGSSSSASSTQTALSTSGSAGSGSGGLGTGATVAIAVIIPIAAVVGFVIFGLWFWRRRKAKKNAEELRKNEMAEYGYNPNSDPTLPVGAAYTEGGSEGNDDSGYRGWGATSSTNRKASTTLGSNSRAAAMGGVGGAMSDGGSQNGYGAQPSPSAGAGSDGTQDPLIHGYPDATTVGAAALGGAAVMGAAGSRHSQASNGIHRGVSNASSAYSGHGARSEASSDVPDMPRPYYQEEVPYNIYNEAQPGHGPYGDGTYGGQNDEPVIRDVQARRNTRIERAPTFPQQGGIAQNF